MAFIETRGIRQRRDGGDILKNINLRVERGEVFALIGPTGAGKTTLLRLIDLIDTPTEGRIFFDGVDVTASERVRLEARRRMAFVLQKPVVFNMSVYENIAHGLRWRGAGRRQVHERVEGILETVGMSEYRKRNARTLSGGEVQRVAIARAIATEPELLLLDEPTANLDPVSASKIEELIADIIKRDSITVIMATHDMVQGERLADRISVMMNGEIVQTGDPRSIFNTPHNRAVAELVGMENILDGTVVTNDGESRGRLRGGHRGIGMHAAGGHNGGAGQDFHQRAQLAGGGGNLGGVRGSGVPDRNRLRVQAGGPGDEAERRGNGAEKGGKGLCQLQGREHPRHQAALTVGK